MKALTSMAALAALTLSLNAPLSWAQEAAADETPVGGARAMVLSVEAVVTKVDPETKQVSLEGPMGNPITLTAREEVVSIDDIKVGDVLAATYMAALEGELREPTEEELAEPWVVLEDAAVSESAEQPGIGGARLIRAVCTIEGMNRLLGTVTVLDSRGAAHVITDVEPEKMSNVTLGQSIVLVYTEALAISLEHVQQ
ncbi:hypothetical protein [Parahalioglobus pacificus]|uniref:Uncharacterized protein n=1 Tax=Parahalioglobus pacificus TaxID=930806 RepID=A0A918XFI6_9GAMM|nr:hypothetical protein [Halioglobus pacificus]GHD29665.1 hypothetical protein GCM10007053_10590 [Halioglobus pacificus]